MGTLRRGLPVTVLIGAMMTLPAASNAASPIVFTGVGGNNTSTTAGTANAAKAAFEAAIGGANNGQTPGQQPNGFRTITWDAVPSTDVDPNPLPPGFFNSNSPRGVVLATPGTGMEVSRQSPPSFGDINSLYPTTFPAFSPSRIFSPMGSTVTDVTFYAAGTATHATVAGFGAIFLDVGVSNTSSIEYFGTTGQSLGKFFAPTGPTGQAEFLGALFDSPVVSRVEITTGTTPLGPDNNPPTTNVVALDDFAYAEPQAVPPPTLTVNSPADNATVNDPNVTVSGSATDPTGLGPVTVDGNLVGVSADGSWNAAVGLSAGPNTIRVVATNTSGNGTEVDRTVTYVPISAFHFKKLIRNKKRGTAKLPVTVQSPGALSLRGKGVVPLHQAGDAGPPKTVLRPGTVNLPIKPKGKLRRKLERRGTAKVNVKVTFVPTGGAAKTRSKTIKLIRKH